MIFNRNVMLVLSTGAAAVAAVLAIQRHARQQEAVQEKTDLQTWESEGGSTAAPAVVKQPSA